MRSLVGDAGYESTAASSCRRKSCTTEYGEQQQFEWRVKAGSRSADRVSEACKMLHCGPRTWVKCAETLCFRTGIELNSSSRVSQKLLQASISTNQALLAKGPRRKF